MSRKIQVIKYKCCGKIFSACCEPECYTDEDYLKELKKYVERGDTVEMVEPGQWKFEKCNCITNPINKKPVDLFNQHK